MLPELSTIQEGIDTVNDTEGMERIPFCRHLFLTPDQVDQISKALTARLC